MSDSQRQFQINQQHIENLQEYVYRRQLTILGKQIQKGEITRRVKLGNFGRPKRYKEKSGNTHKPKEKLMGQK